jgi:uncharacterized membrane protein
MQIPHQHFLINPNFFQFFFSHFAQFLCPFGSSGSGFGGGGGGGGGGEISLLVLNVIAVIIAVID